MLHSLEHKEKLKAPNRYLSPLQHFALGQRYRNCAKENIGQQSLCCEDTAFQMVKAYSSSDRTGHSDFILGLWPMENYRKHHITPLVLPIQQVNTFTAKNNFSTPTSTSHPPKNAQMKTERRNVRPEKEDDIIASKS